MFINYAHRGASSYFPENTMSSFFAGIAMGANGIETDVHKTRDGVLVLFHDDTLDRVTGCAGNVSDLTYEELLRVRVKNGGREDIIPTFEDFLKYFSFRDLDFAIEIKQEGVEKETVDMLEKYGMCEKTVITSFHFDSLCRVKEYCPKYRIGYLYLMAETDEDARNKVLSVGGEQVCPNIKRITPELVADTRAHGLSIRAYAVGDEEKMRRGVELGIDGMTVNFPDKLTEYLESIK